MSETLRAYQEALRELEKVEDAFKRDETDALTLQEARQRAQEATKAWEEERSTLSEQARVKYATDAARDEVAMKPSAPAETELEHVKRRIKECRKALYAARDDNKALYAQLAANRETKRRLNSEYDELRQRKKQLEGGGLMGTTRTCPNCGKPTPAYDPKLNHRHRKYAELCGRCRALALKKQQVSA